MRKTPKLGVVAGLIVAVGFVLGLGRLFVLRFAAGDVYPIYSSMRADPLGTRAFYESLQDSGRFAVKRNFAALDRLGVGRRFTLFCLAASPASFALRSPQYIQRLHELALSGARLVLTVGSQAQAAASVNTAEAARSERGCPEDRGPSPAPQHRHDAASHEPAADAGESLKSKWQVTIACSRLPENSPAAVLNRGSAENDLPATLPWHSGCYFTELSAAWQVVYAADKRPLVIERALGQGTLILIADTFPLSNEALRNERRPGLLAWLAGPYPQVVFEETHLGLHQNPGVAALAMRAGLHWPLAAALVAALLFVWKNAAPFVPPPQAESAARTSPVSSDKDYTEGLISLLHRSISKNRLLETMLAQWQKDLPRSRRISETRQVRIRTVLAAGSGSRATVDPLSGYHRIYQLISEKSDEK